MRSADAIRAGALLLGAASLLAAPGCKKGRFRKDQNLGGHRISAKELNRGHQHYGKNCEACHGEKGNGKGPAAPGTVPPPRDFTQGFFKYISVADSGLPTDDDLVRSARRGVPGTRMPSWTGMPEGRLRAVIHYIKTFSPRWRKRKQTSPIPRKPDPWQGAEARARAEKRGDAIYHGAAQCWTCHPAYRTRTRLMEAVRASERARGRTAPKAIPVRSDVHGPALVETRYGKLRPPDFLSDTPRGGDEDADLYRTVAAGIGGTPMPTWYRRLPPRDLWAVVHYVKRLLRLQDTPEGKALKKRMKAGRLVAPTDAAVAVR